jgi:uncharacterized protein YbjQ (UPF0145 family)
MIRTTTPLLEGGVIADYFEIVPSEAIFGGRVGH